MPRPNHSRLTHIRAHQLRMELTVSEASVWSAIKNKATGARFRRQVPIGGWIPDFACLRPKIIVEIDDPSHDWRDETDRTVYLESLGFTVLRFTNEEVAKELADVVGTIEYWVEVLQ